MRNVGCFGKRKFLSDIRLVKQIQHAIKTNHSICALYPEARYSLVGTTAILPDSLGKMIKFLQVPVVTLMCHGHHLYQPAWNLYKRSVPTSADMTLLWTPEEIKNLNAEAINQQLKTAFAYDDYQYQLEQNIHIKSAQRAQNLHKVLYQCPACETENSMRSQGITLWCDHCQKYYDMGTNGQLKARSGITEFPHIPDWFEWQRKQVRQQIEQGTYRLESTVYVDILPNSTGFYRLGEGTFIHNEKGIHLQAPWGTIEKTVSENYGIHIEYDYFGKGDGFSFSNPNETFYLFPHDPKFSVTKLHFAVEELYKWKVKKEG